MNVYGKYNGNGYTILDEQGNKLYSAGNSPFDSQQDATGFTCALPLDEIRSCCITSAAMIAEENGGKVLSIDYNENEG
jgi:hypothetical protein